MDLQKIVNSLKKFDSLQVLVLGDVMLDRFIWGAVKRISPEAPVPVVEVSHETAMLGGAGNVLRNLVSLGARAHLCAVVGEDAAGAQVGQLLAEQGDDLSGLFSCAGRPTTVKSRVVAHSQQVVRVDREKRGQLPQPVLDSLREYLEKEILKVDAVIVSDYAKGVINPLVLPPLLNATGKIVTVDPKVENVPLFKNVTVVTPNHLEAAAAAGVSLDDADHIDKSGQILLQQLNSQAVLITQGEQGMSLFTRAGKVHIPTMAQEVFDVTGAGDTVISTLTLGLAAGLSLAEAAFVANRAAGIAVGEVGTSAVKREVLLAALQNM